MVAIAWSLPPFPKLRDSVAGVTIKAVATAEVTVRFVEPVTDSSVAISVTVPAAFAVTLPVGLTVAAAPDEDHVADWVRFCTDPSVYFPVAVSCPDSPTGKVAGLSPTAMLTSVAGPTETAAVAVAPRYVADSCDAPLPTPVTLPWGLTVATAGWAEIQVTLEVTSCVVPLLKLAVAWAWWLVPKLMDSDAGTTVRLITAGEVTDRLADPDKVPEVAVIIVVPIPSAIALPAALTVAIPDVDELHVADWVRSWTVPSEKLPVAVSWADSPSGKEDGFGLIVILDNAGGATTIDVTPATPW
jgi:hypothetical protein